MLIHWLAWNVSCVALMLISRLTMLGHWRFMHLRLMFPCQLKISMKNGRLRISQRWLKMMMNWNQSLTFLQTHDQQPGREDLLALDDITERYWAQWPRLVLKNGILYRKWETADGSQQSLQWIPPKSCRTELIKTVQVHSGFTGGHFAASKTMHQVQRRAYWATWKSDVKYFLSFVCWMCHLSSW